MRKLVAMENISCLSVCSALPVALHKDKHKHNTKLAICSGIHILIGHLRCTECRPIAQTMGQTMSV